jgi:signal peptidase I
MNQLLFAGWLAAAVVLFLPLRTFLRLIGRYWSARQSPIPAAAAPGPEETRSSRPGSYVGTAKLSLPRGATPETPTAGRMSHIIRRIAPVLSFLLYVAFIAGAIYHIPQVLSWTLDTSHPMASVSSQSMWPSLKKGDLIFLQGVDKPEDLQVGDIIAFEHERGITVHRIVEIDGDLITTRGDANPRDDKPISFDQVCGRVLTIGGRLAKVPYVGSIAGLFGPLAGQTGQAPDEQGSPTEESSETTAASPGSASEGGQILPGQSHAASPGTTELVSVDSAGNQANGVSTWPTISADGRFVAFASSASNLVSGDTNGQTDVFVHDRQTGATERVSIDTAGSQANGSSEAPAISADGRFVAFVSAASNFVPEDSNSQNDVFVHDRRTGTTERMSVDSAGNQADGRSDAPAISGDGRFVAFVAAASNLVVADSNGADDVFVHDRQTGTTERISIDTAGTHANGSSEAPAISADGHLIAFVSAASNLVPGDSNSQNDVFVHDRQTGITERVSVDSTANQADGDSDDPAISGDGRFIAFESKARNLVPGDTNRREDIFVHDRETGVTERVSVDSAGDQANSGASGPAISADGRFVSFYAGHSSLVPGDSNRRQDVFIHDRETGATEWVSVDSAGNQGNDHSGGLSALGANGRFVAFPSLASNLAPGDMNLTQDVFVRARYLNPALGRFTSADSVQPNAPGTRGYNVYSYVANNPTTCDLRPLSVPLIMGIVPPPAA